jgi:hypothetical protein
LLADLAETEASWLAEAREAETVLLAWLETLLTLLGSAPAEEALLLTEEMEL